MTSAIHPLLRDPCLIPAASMTGSVLKRLDIIRFEDCKCKTDLSFRMGRIVVEYLLIPIYCMTLPITFCYDVVHFSVLHLWGMIPQWKTHLTALMILFVTLPIRIPLYLVWDKGLLFPIDFKHKSMKGETHPLLELIQDPEIPKSYIAEKLQSCGDLSQNMTPEEGLVFSVALRPGGLECLRKWRGKLFLDSNLLSRLLFIAVELEDQELVRRLRDKGANVRQCFSHNINLGTPLSRVIQKAALSKQPLGAFANFLMNECEVGVNDDPSHVAAAIDDLPCLQMLAHHKADFNIHLPSGHTALTHAIVRGDVSIVAFLLQQQVCQDAPSMSAVFHRRTPSEIARMKKNPQMMALFADDVSFPTFPEELFTKEICEGGLIAILPQIRAGVLARDPWQIFGLARDADPSAVDVAFRKAISLGAHPDKNLTEPEFANQLFVALQAVREILKKPPT